MTPQDRERSVLTSFLDIDDLIMDKKNTFLLSEDAFTSELRKRIAIKINATTNTDKMYGFLRYELETSIVGTIFEQEWNEISGINAQIPLPLTLAKRYHDDIREAYNKKDGDRI